MSGRLGVGLFGRGLLAPFDRDDAVEPHGAVVPRLERGLIGHPRRRAADVERPHRELRAGLADGLRGDDAHRQPQFDQPAGRQVASVALRAHAAARRAREHRPDLDALDAGVFDAVGQRLVEFSGRRHDDLARRRIHDRVEGDSSDDAVAQPLDDLAARVDDGASLEAVHRPAVDFRDDHVLRDVHEAPREVPGVRGLQRGVREALAGAVRRDEVLQHGQPFTEVRRDGRLDDFAGRLRHQAAHAGELPDLLLAAAGAGVRHDVDRVEALPGLVERLHLAEHLVGDALGHFRPDGDDLVLPLAVGDRAFLVLTLDLDDLVARVLDEVGLLPGMIRSLMPIEIPDFVA